MGLIYLDANVFITAFEADESVASPVRKLFAAARSRPNSCVTSELTIAEVLAPATAPGSLALSRKMEIYQTVLLWSGLVEVLPITRSILMDTAVLRAAHRQRLPDAIHVVTALHATCAYFCSADRDARRIPAGLTLLVPDDAGVSLALNALEL